MTVIFPNAQELRFGIQTDDLIVFNEVTALQLAILNARNASLYEAQVSNGTTMTSTTLNSWLTFNVNLTNSSLTIPSHGYTIGELVQITTTNTLPAPLYPGYNYWVIVLNSNSIQLALSYANALAGTFITLTNVGLGVNQIRAYTISQVYWQVWQHLMENRTYQIQMENVISYFCDLGYLIRRLTNTVTNTTFLWDVKW